MSRSAKIVGVALAGGLMMACVIAVGITLDRNVMASAPEEDVERTPYLSLREELLRCRNLMLPDNACEAAWDEHRRQFFGMER